MMISQAEARGRVLLVAAAPRRSRRRLLDPEHGVSAFAAVPTGQLLRGWNGPVDVVQLVDPGEPQALLARLQEAAAVGGPLLVYMCGQLVRDHRQRQVHLGLARTTESTIRYDALPWPWVARELAGRAPGTTTVVLDLIADPSCWPLADADIELPEQVARWGVVAPPVRRGPWQPPTYTTHLAQLLRTAPAGQHLTELHPLAVAQAGLDRATVAFAPPAVEAEVPRPRVALPPPPAVAVLEDGGADPRPAIAEAMRAGHHHAAAELAAQWERTVLRTAGPRSAQMGDVLEVQATTAAAAGATVRAAERWVATAEHRLGWTRPDDPAVQLAARNAFACWHQLDADDPEAAAIGQQLVRVLQALGRRAAADAIQERLTGRQARAYAPPTGRGA